MVYKNLYIFDETKNKNVTMKMICFYPEDIKAVKIFWAFAVEKLNYEPAFSPEKTRFEIFYDEQDEEWAKLAVNIIKNAVETKAIKGTITTEC